MKKYLLVLFTLVLVICGCKSQEETTQVMTTTNPLSVITKATVSDTTSVDSLLPKGSDYHHYEPSASELARVYSANYFICIGENSEPFVKTIKANAPSSLVIVELSTLLADNDQFDANDPHFWLSPQAALLVMQQIETKLSDTFGLNANYQKHCDDLKLVSDNYQQTSDTNNQVPIIVDHDGLAYLQLDYNFNIINIYGKNEEQEPSSQDIANLVSLIKQDNIKTIYCFEYDSHIQIINTLVNETGVNVKTIDNLLSVDNFDIYLQGLQNNLEAFKNVQA